MTTGVAGDTGGPRTLGGLDNVDLTGLATNNLLQFDGGNWVPGSPLFDGTAGSDLTTWNLTSWSAVKVVEFAIVIEVAGGVGTVVIRAPYLNGDTTSGNYHRNQIGSQNGGSPAGFESATQFGWSIPAGDKALLTGRVVNAAGETFISVRASRVISTSEIDQDEVQIIWNGTDAQIDQLSVAADTANAIDANSYARVWEGGKA